MNDESLTYLVHVFIDFSKRAVTVLDTDGNERHLNFSQNLEGAEDFTATCSEIVDLVDSDMITYTFAEQ
tara:strand:+ start:2913 stop:3119 length:207 start_codon:yes stop_codon:yes gene_type:complete